MNKDEKPWIVSYYNKEQQLSEEEHEAFLQALTDKNEYVKLKDGRILSTRFQTLEPNPHYVSEDSIKKTRQKWDLWYEYQDLKKQGVVKTIDEYKEWKKDSLKKMKEFKEYIGKGKDKNEKKRTT